MASDADTLACTSPAYTVCTKTYDYLRVTWYRIKGSHVIGGDLNMATGRTGCTVDCWTAQFIKKERADSAKDDPNIIERNFHKME